jgi:hypothetical protein
VSAKAFAVTQEGDKKRLSFRFADAGEPVVRWLPCLNQVSQLPCFERVQSIGSLVLGIKKVFHPRNIKDGKPRTISHANRTTVPAFIFNLDGHRQPPILMR